MSPTTWRPYRPQDEPALRAAHAVQCQTIGAEFAYPELRDPHYVMALVAERGGEARGALVAHATLELMWIGGDRPMLRDAIRRRDWLANELRAIGADEAHAFVPRSALPGMEFLLRRLGFRRSNENYLPFYREL